MISGYVPINRRIITFSSLEFFMSTGSCSCISLVLNVNTITVEKVVVIHRGE